MKMSYSCHVLVMFDVMPRSKNKFRLMLSKSYANLCDTYLVRPLFQGKFTYIRIDLGYVANSHICILTILQDHIYDIHVGYFASSHL